MRPASLCMAWLWVIGSEWAGRTAIEEDDIDDLLDVLDIEDALLLHPSSDLTRKS